MAHIESLNVVMPVLFLSSLRLKKEYLFPHYHAVSILYTKLSPIACPSKPATECVCGRITCAEGADAFEEGAMVFVPIGSYLSILSG